MHRLGLGPFPATACTPQELAARVVAEGLAELPVPPVKGVAAAAAPVAVALAAPPAPLPAAPATTASAATALVAATSPAATDTTVPVAPAAGSANRSAESEVASREEPQATQPPPTDAEVLETAAVEAAAPLRELPASVQPLPAARLSSPKGRTGGEGGMRPENAAPAFVAAPAALAFAAAPAAPAFTAAPAFAAAAPPHDLGGEEALPALSGAKRLAAKLAARATAGVAQPAAPAAPAAPGGRRLAKVGVWGAVKPAPAGVAPAAAPATVALQAVAAPAVAVAAAPANPFLAKRPAFLAAAAPPAPAPPPPSKRPRAAAAAAASSSDGSSSDSGSDGGGQEARAVRARVNGAAGLPPPSSQPASGSQRRSGRFGAACTPQVALSGAVGARRTQLMAALRALDVRCGTAEKGEWEEGTTHVLVAGRLARGEKTLAALAAGALIASDTLVDASSAAGRWLGGDSGAEARHAVDGGEAIAAGAPAHWRSRAAATGSGAFAGIGAAVLGKESAYGAASAASLRRILTAGGASVLVTTAQARAALRAGELQLVLLPSATDPAGKEFLAAAAAGGPAVALPGFVVSWLAAPADPLAAHILAWGGLQPRAAARGSVIE